MLLCRTKVLRTAFLYLRFRFVRKNTGANALIKCWWNWRQAFVPFTVLHTSLCIKIDSWFKTFQWFSCDETVYNLWIRLNYLSHWSGILKRVIPGGSKNRSGFVVDGRAIQVNNVAIIFVAPFETKKIKSVSLPWHCFGLDFLYKDKNWLHYFKTGVSNSKKCTGHFLKN